MTGVNKYVAAVKLLFDPELSQQELLSIDVTGPRTIEVNWRLGGYAFCIFICSCTVHKVQFNGTSLMNLGCVDKDNIGNITLKKIIFKG